MTSRVLIGAFVVAATACGHANPARPTLQFVDASGTWTYTSTVMTVNGGECVAASSLLGATDSGTMSIMQAGATLSAASRSSVDGSSCTYTGTAGTSSITLEWTSCEAGNLLRYQCANGALRDGLMKSNSINATISGKTANGTQAQSFTVVVSGTTTGVGVLALAAKFSASR